MKNYLLLLTFLCAGLPAVASAEAAGGGASGNPLVQHDRESEERFEFHLQHSHNRILRGVTMVARFAGHLSGLHKDAAIEARRHISGDGSVEYTVLTREGDKTIQKELILRVMTTEMDARTPGDDISVTPANYKFKLKSSHVQNGRQTEVFEVRPRKKRVGLFKGEVWVDVDTGLTVHEAGQFVKSPSVFLKTIRFTREYAIREGFALPTMMVISTQTRLWGTAELSVEYSDLAWDGGSAAIPTSQE